MSYVSVSELQRRNGIYIRSITEGMHNYLCYILEGSKEQYDAFLMQLLGIGSKHLAFADFYYKRLTVANTQLLKKHLTQEESLLLDRLVRECGEVKAEEEFCILQLTEEILRLLLHISYEELLFSSFYYTHMPCTVWSNYGGRFLVFTREQQHCDWILEMARKAGLEVES